MRIFEPFRRTRDNKEVINEIRNKTKPDNLLCTNILLSDISISLAVIADCLNYFIKIKEE